MTVVAVVGQLPKLSKHPQKSDDGCNDNHDSNVVLLTSMSIFFTLVIMTYEKSIPTEIVNRQLMPPGCQTCI